MTVFRVENCLFRVHRHFLTNNSPIFNSMFSLPLGSMDGSTAEGTCDTNPIYLSGVTVLEFETLLQYFYNRFGSCPTYCANGTRLTARSPAPAAHRRGWIG
ncbi:hypothetical protein BJV78DRAFT_1207408 [Lactifluus subvellereus]|nr:hypothetical protein BJV78DRAFT_1207408 [Lactifluus subvellereus]